MNNKKRLTISYIILLLLLAAVFVLSIFFGSVRLSVNEIFNGLSGDDITIEIILKKIRLPRVLASMLAGGALASCGSVLQKVTANDLCAPNIIGTNSGAGFGVILLLCFAPGFWALIPAVAFLGAVISTFTVLGISFAGKSKTNGSIIVLAGVALSALFSAGISYLSIRYPDILTSYTAFSVGGFSGVTLKELYIPFIIIFSFLIILQLISNKLNILEVGDEIALSLGLKVKFLRIIALISASALSASAVSFAGLLGFVGLIIPHITKRLITNDMRFELSISFIMGAVIVTVADLAGRIIFAPSEIPCGIIMGMIGAPFFIFLLIKRRVTDDRM